MATYDLASVSAPSASSLRTGDIIDCSYCGAAKSITLPKGTYKLECWGAQGGSYNTTYTGGKGGYSVGTITFTEPTTVYLVTGQQNNTYGRSEGAQSGTAFNGGGYGTTSSYSSTYTYSCAGGGGSDIRIGSNSLYARVIVAGGGSGSTNRVNGYAGGGTTSAGYNSAYQATQTKAGEFGSFGIGANCVPQQTDYKYVSAGGGGGWYGGGSSDDYSDDTSTNNRYHGGGSGYVYTSSTATNYPSGCQLNSSYYLTDASTTAGSASFTSPTGTSETGHSGHGYVRITVLDISVNLILVKTNNSTWKQASSIYLKIEDGVWAKKEV